MADIIKCRTSLRFDVDPITRFGESEEVFSGSECVGPSVAGVELEVLGESLIHAHQHPVVCRSTRVLVRTDSGEVCIRPLTEEEESGMRGISDHRRRTQVTLTE